MKKKVYLIIFCFGVLMCNRMCVALTNQSNTFSPDVPFFKSILSGGSRISQRRRPANPREECADLLFGNIFTENFMKMKEFGQVGGSLTLTKCRFQNEILI